MIGWIQKLGKERAGVKQVVTGLLVALTALAPIACGAGKDAGSTREEAASRASKASLDARAGGYRNDGDGDPVNDGDLDDPHGATQVTGTVDSDKDFAEDHQNPGNGSYHDRDDGQIVGFGHEAPARDRRAIAQLVERYYAIAAARDGVAACALLPHPLAASAVEDFGSASAAAPAYLRHASTCPAVLADMFAHEHSEVAGMHVTDVRVDGAEAMALLGSDRASASSIALSRVNGRWQLEAMIGKPLN